RSAELQGTGAHGADPVGDPVGVPVHHFDLVDVDAEPVGDQHGVGGPVALPVRGTAGQHQHAAVRPDLDVPGFPVGRVGRGDFDVAGQPDAELPRIAPFPARGLLGAQRLVVGRLQHRVQGFLV